jgi:hypothetical protein
MLYNDISRAALLREKLESLKGVVVTDGLVASLVFVAGESGAEIAREWFAAVGKARIPNLVRAWIRDQRDALKAQLSALDAQIAQDLASGSADVTP